MVLTQARYNQPPLSMGQASEMQPVPESRTDHYTQFMILSSWRSSADAAVSQGSVQEIYQDAVSGRRQKPSNVSATPLPHYSAVGAWRPDSQSHPLPSRPFRQSKLESRNVWDCFVNSIFEPTESWRATQARPRIRPSRTARGRGSRTTVLNHTHAQRGIVIYRLHGSSSSNICMMHSKLTSLQ
jgi:hypothetical protein